jgi:hypothetical protein
MWAQSELPDGTPAPTATPVPQQNDPKESRDVSVNPKVFARNFLSDQKEIWTFPAKLATGRHWVPTLAVLGATAVVAAAVDPAEGRYFRKHESTFTDFNNALSESRTTAATLLTPAAFYGIGLITRNKYAQKTGLLAAEAWVDVDILDEVIRNIPRRRRPLDIPPNGNFSNTWFKTPLKPLAASGGFPSGHTAWAFAVATVVARRYPTHKWVRFTAYGLATAILASRLTSSNHFASDDVFGAAIGYTTARFVVLRQ